MRPGRISAALLVGSFLVIAVAAALTFVGLPYVVMSPGPATNILGENDGKPLLTVDGAQTYPTSGSLDFTTVSVTGGPGGKVTVFDVVGARLSGSDEVLPVEQVFPPEASQEQVEQEVAQWAHRIVAKRLPAPTVRLKAQAANGNSDTYLHVLQELFALDQHLASGHDVAPSENRNAARTGFADHDTHPRPTPPWRPGLPRPATEGRPEKASQARRRQAGAGWRGDSGTTEYPAGERAQTAGGAGRTERPRGRGAARAESACQVQRGHQSIVTRTRYAKKGQAGDQESGRCCPTLRESAKTRREVQTAGDLTAQEQGCQLSLIHISEPTKPS